MKLEVALLAGAETKQFLADLTKQIDRLDALLKGTESTVELIAEGVAEKEFEEAEEEETPAPKKSAKKSKAFEEEDAEEAEEVVEEEEASEEEDEDDFKAPPKKAAPKKAKKITIDDLNDACKKKAKSGVGRDGILKLLKKHFKTQSVSAIKPEDYERFMEVMAVED